MYLLLEYYEDLPAEIIRMCAKFIIRNELSIQSFKEIFTRKGSDLIDEIIMEIMH